MLFKFHLSTLPLAMFLGAIVCTAASRNEDDDRLPALTDQANDYQQIVYDVDGGVNSSVDCTMAQINEFWNNGGVRTHLNSLPYDGCGGGHVVSRYLYSLGPDVEKIRKVVVQGCDSGTGLLTVSSYEYRSTSAPWGDNPKKCVNMVKTLWNDDAADLGKKLKEFGVQLPKDCPELGWTFYKKISVPNSEVEIQCKRALLAHKCKSNTGGSYVTSAFNPVTTLKLCINVVMGQNDKGKDYWTTCYAAKIAAQTGDPKTPC